MYQGIYFYALSFVSSTIKVLRTVLETLPDFVKVKEKRSKRLKWRRWKEPLLTRTKPNKDEEDAETFQVNSFVKKICTKKMYFDVLIMKDPFLRMVANLNRN